jgi:DNA polymerase III psi subunit
MLKLELRRPQASLQGESQTLLTQASYLLSRSDKSPFVKSLLLEPSLKDLNHLFFLEKSQARLLNLAHSLPILKLKTKLNTWRVPPHLLPEKTAFLAFAYIKNGEIVHLTLPQDTKKASSSSLLQAGYIIREGNKLIFENKPLLKPIPLFIEEGMTFTTYKLPETLKELKFHVRASLQGHTLEGNIPWDGLEIAEIEKKILLNFLLLALKSVECYYLKTSKIAAFSLEIRAFLLMKLQQLALSKNKDSPSM